jgi:hypothetical protein
MQWRSRLRHCATGWKVLGSIPNGVFGIFHWHNPSSHTMALGLTQPLTEISTRNISCGVKAARAYGWQPYHLHVLTVLKSGSLNLLKPWGPVQACNGIALPSSIKYQLFNMKHIMTILTHTICNAVYIHTKIFQLMLQHWSTLLVSIYGSTSRRSLPFT